MPDPALPPLGQATSQTDLVAQVLREAILQGTYGPDEVLVERKLASQLGVSKTPVREALIQLSRSGLVVTSRNRGVRVRSVSDQDTQHVYEQRALLEPWAVAAAVRAGSIDLVAADHLLGSAESSIADEDWSTLVQLNRRFHRQLYGPCPNPLVTATLDELQDLTALVTLHEMWQHSATRRQEQAEHRALLDRARAGDAEGAEQLMRDHITHSLRRYASS